MTLKIDTVNQSPFALSRDGAKGLTLIKARVEEVVPFSLDIFDAFTSMRVLTYSADIPMLGEFARRFDDLEIVFGYERILGDIGHLVAFQDEVIDNIILELNKLGEDSIFIFDKISRGKLRLFVVKEDYEHSKLYIAQNDRDFLVLTGSGNLTRRGFRSGEIFTQLMGDLALAEAERKYNEVRRRAAQDLKEYILDKQRVNIEKPVDLEHVPVIKEAAVSTEGLTVAVNTYEHRAWEEVHAQRIERKARKLDVVKSVIKLTNGAGIITPRVARKVIKLTRQQQPEPTEREPAWLTVKLDTGAVICSGKPIALTPDATQVSGDARRLLHYFAELENGGFYGDIPKLQRKFFMFWNWLYFSPFLCDMRNYANAHSDYSVFSYPHFGILYGQSSSGKSSLIRALLTSMFGYYMTVANDTFTAPRMVDAQLKAKRFPLFFDDMSQKRFGGYDDEVIKGHDDWILTEYPAVVLSMNADVKYLKPEISKRCFAMHINAASNNTNDDTLPSQIRAELTDALYRQYLAMVMERLQTEKPRDFLAFSSEIICDLLATAQTDLPAWCTPATYSEYLDIREDNAKATLLYFYHHRAGMFEIRTREVILHIDKDKATTWEVSRLKKSLPSYVIDEVKSKAGQIVMRRAALEAFIGVSFTSWRWAMNRVRNRI